VRRVFGMQLGTVLCYGEDVCMCKSGCICGVQVSVWHAVRALLTGASGAGVIDVMQSVISTRLLYVDSLDDGCVFVPHIITCCCHRDCLAAIG